MNAATAAIKSCMDWGSTRKDKILVSVSQSAVSQAEHAIEGCEQCSPDVSLTFARLLHSFRNYPGDQVEYILPVLARCPNCSAEINEDTLVKAKHIRSKASLL
jgi:hypothetical protein